MKCIVVQTLGTDYSKVFDNVTAKSLKAKSFANRAAQTERLNAISKIITDSLAPHDKVLAYYNSSILAFIKALKLSIYSFLVSLTLRRVGYVLEHLHDQNPNFDFDKQFKLLIISFICVGT